MRKIKAEPLTKEAFAPYGTFTNVADPSGYRIGSDVHDFYRDSAVYYAEPGLPMGLSPLTVKEHGRKVDAVEWHNNACEAMMPVNDDAIMHVSLASGDFDPSTTKAFIVPKGTIIAMNPGVYHLMPLPVKEAELHALIILPERAYVKDFYLKELSEDEQFEIEL